MKFLCYGTREMEECTCGGDVSRCDFYPEKRDVKMKLEPCPYCGAELEDDWYTIHEYKTGHWVLSHNCKHGLHELGVCINVYGSTKEETVDRWNTRAEEALTVTQELEFTRQFIHEHGLEFALASAWKRRGHQ
jgi:hypothetical protein